MDTIDLTLFPGGVWVDDVNFCRLARHVVVRKASFGCLIGAAKLTRHKTLEGNYRDIRQGDEGRKYHAISTSTRLWVVICEY